MTNILHNILNGSCHGKAVKVHRYGSLKSINPSGGNKVTASENVGGPDRLNKHDMQTSDSSLTVYMYGLSTNGDIYFSGISRGVDVNKRTVTTYSCSFLATIRPIFFLLLATSWPKIRFAIIEFVSIWCYYSRVDYHFAILICNSAQLPVFA